MAYESEDGKLSFCAERHFSNSRLLSCSPMLCRLHKAQGAMPGMTWSKDLRGGYGAES